MAITINGTGTITGLTAGGLPDGSITTDDIAANAVTAAKLAAGAGGKILQVQSTLYTTTTSVTADGTGVDLPFSVNITPSSTSNYILVYYSLFGEPGTEPFYAGGVFSRTINGTRSVITAPASGNRSRKLSMLGCDSNIADADSTPGTIQIHGYKDSPGTTSQITYSPAVCTRVSATWYVNRTVGFTDNNYYSVGASWITVMEVAA